MMMKKGTRTFLSYKEALIALPQMRRRFVELMKKNQLISILETTEVIYDDDYEYYDADIRKNKAIYQLSFDFYKEVSALFEQGFLVKDADQGYVDIFSDEGGKKHFLCYNVHEGLITHWHELHEDCPDRRHLSTFPAQEKEKTERS